METDYNIYQ